MRNRLWILLLLFLFAVVTTQGLLANEDDPLLPDDGEEEIENPDPDEDEDPLFPDEGEKPGEKPGEEAKKPEITACKDCTAKKMCPSHVEKEEETLDRLKDFLKKKWKKEQEKEREAQLIALLEEAAALTQEHPQYKSKGVAEALGKVLMSELNIEVRGKLLDLLDDRQREDVCLTYLQKYVLIKDHNTEAMTSAAIAAMAYFENPKLVVFFKGFFDNPGWRIRNTAIECIAYTGGHAGISALISLFDECLRLANKRGWGNPWSRINDQLKKLTNHIPDVKTNNLRQADIIRYHAKDWKDWWRSNSKRYEQPEKTDQERKAWKGRVRTFKQDSPNSGGNRGGGGRGGGGGFGEDDEDDEGEGHGGEDR